MHNTLGHAGGSRGIHDVERVIKGQINKIDLGCVCHELGDPLGAGIAR